jgi:hypothetical protein
MVFDILYEEVSLVFCVWTPGGRMAINSSLDNKSDREMGLPCKL